LLDSLLQETCIEPKMSIIKLKNVRGSDSHYKAIEECVKRHLYQSTSADVVFICNGQEKVYGHKHLLIRVSPMLQSLLSKNICCKCEGKDCYDRVTQPEDIYLEFDASVVRDLLGLLYSGYVKVKHPKDVLQLMGVLGINISVDVNNLLSSSEVLRDISSKDANRNFSTVNSREAMQHPVNPAYSANPMELLKAKKPMVNAIFLNVEMAKLLKGKPSIECRAEGCTEIVTLKNLTRHIQKHSEEERAIKSEHSKKKPRPTNRMPGITLKPNPDVRVQGTAPVTSPPKPFPPNSSSSPPRPTRARTPSSPSRFTQSASSPRPIRPRTPGFGQDPDAYINNIQTNTTGTEVKTNKRSLADEISDTSDESDSDDKGNSWWDSPPEKNHKRPKLASPAVSTSSPLSNRNSNTSNTPTPAISPRAKHSPMSDSQGSVTPSRASFKLGHYRSPPKSASKVSAHRIELPSNGSEKPYACKKCGIGFRKFVKLRTHYTEVHFWDNLKIALAHLGNKCTICMKVYNTDDHLVQHMANFHSYVDKYMKECNLDILNQERTVRVLTHYCSSCERSTSDSTDMKNHLSIKHFNKQLIREHGLDPSSVTHKCPKCGKVFSGNILLLVKHLGSFHDEVLKYAEKSIVLEEGERDFVPQDDFDDGTEGQPYKEEESEYSSKKDVSHGDDIPFELFGGFFCQICDQKFSSSGKVKQHYLEHGDKLNFRETDKKLDCSFCSQQFSRAEETLRHMARTHASKFLLPRMRAFGLWVGERHRNLDKNLYKPKAVNVMVKKSKIKCFSEVQPKSELIAPVKEKSTKTKSVTAKAKAPSIPTLCPVESCQDLTVKKEKKEMMLHLLNSHFYDQVQQEYKLAWESDKNKCVLCSKILGEVGVLKTYLSHLAEEHQEVVLKHLPSSPIEPSSPSKGLIYARKSLPMEQGAVPPVQTSYAVAMPTAPPHTVAAVKPVERSERPSAKKSPKKMKNFACKSLGGGPRIAVRNPASINQQVEREKEEAPSPSSASDLERANNETLSRINIINKQLLSNSDSSESD